MKKRILGGFLRILCWHWAHSHCKGGWLGMRYFIVESGGRSLAESGVHIIIDGCKLQL